MKKYFGKKGFSESLYYTPPSMMKGLPEYFYEDGFEIGAIPMEFEEGWFRDKNIFEDTNEFSTYQEIFNIYQDGKI